MSDLAERYGTRRKASAQKPNLVWWIAVIGLVVGVVIFWGLSAFNPATTVETQTARFQVISENEASIDARISVHPGSPLVCAVEAQNDVSTVVGFQLLELPPLTEQHRVLSHTLRTTQSADVVLIRECWVPETS